MIAISIVDVLDDFERIVQDELAARFARCFVQQPHRGYGAGATQLLRHIAGGGSWREAAGAMFGGQGSVGNGAAMRAGPVGAYFADDLDEVVRQAVASAEVTHAHPDGQSGAIAVALAAAMMLRANTDPRRNCVSCFSRDLSPSWRWLYARRPDSRCGAVPELPAADRRRTTRQWRRGALVKYCAVCLWCVTRAPRDFERAMWTTVAGLGDRDTTCAIVGSIVGCGAALPQHWLDCREQLPIAFRLSR